MRRIDHRVYRGGQWVRRAAPPIGVTPAPPPSSTVYDVAAGGDIQAVLSAKPADATITIAPGVYRPAANLAPKVGQKIICPAAQWDAATRTWSNGAIIRGDVTLTGWTQDGTASRWYTTSGGLPGPYTDNGQCEIISGANANSCKIREQVWLDGVHLTRVMTLDGVAAGTFYQDQSNGRTYLGVNPAGRLVEMNKRAAAINTAVDRLELRGLSFRRYASAGQSAAVVLSGNDVKVSYCEFTQNHAIGLHLTTADRAHVHHIHAHLNGQLGMGHHRSVNTIIEGNNISRNNTDQFWRADWESGGFKATFSNGTVYRDNWTDWNEGVGAWFDIDNINIDLYGNKTRDNYADGIRYEISQAGKIHDNLVTGNGFRYATSGGRGADYSMFAVAGINVNTSPNVEIFNNTVLNNQNGISLQMRSRGDSATFGIPYDLNNCYVHHNDVELRTGAQFGEGVAGLNSLSPVSTTLYYTPEKNNRFNYNRYQVKATADRKFAWDKNYLTWTNARSSGLFEPNGTLTVVP